MERASLDPPPPLLLGMVVARDLTDVMKHRLNSLYLASSAPAAKAQFYVGILGMTKISPAAFRYGSDEVILSFVPARGSLTAARSDLYWKISIAVPDLDLACRQLIERGVAVDGPRQFLDVGYLAHISDPEGFQIELIQQVFEGTPKPVLRDPEALGGGPVLNLVTLRAAEIGPVRLLCETQLNMRLLCVEPIEAYGFTLYFYAFTDDVPPDPNPEAVVNRTWTYQRPYTVLEIQHVPELKKVTRQPPGPPGFAGLSLTGLRQAEDLLGLLPE